MALTGGDTSSLGTFNTDPGGPLDARQIISGVTEQAYKNWGNQQEMMDWARKQFAKNEGTADTVSARALDTSDKFKTYAARDRDLWESTYVPGMKDQMAFARGYTTPERMAANRAAAGAQSQIATQATRDASERALQGIGVDPSSGRFAGLQAGLDAQAAARSAAAMTKSDRDTEALGQEYLNRAIQTGAVLPGQAVNEAGLGISAGNQAVNAPLAATASGAATMGTPLQWNTAGNQMFNQWLPAAQAQFAAGAQQNRDVFSSNMDMMKLNQQKEQQGSSGMGAALGAGMGILGTVAGSYFGGPLGGSLGGSLGKMAGSGMTARTGGMVRHFDEGGRVPEEMEWRPKFNAEGEGYDYDTAADAGLEPEYNPNPAQGEPGMRWPSRDPRTGMLLKGRQHPTFEHGVDVDRREGYGLEMRDGRYYTQPFKQYEDGGEIGGDTADMISAFANGGDIYPPGMDDEEMEGAQPPEEEFAEGEAPGMVPPEASPSGGENVDDVHAMVSEGEFVMPKDVTSWYGEKFMQNLIKKAREEQAGPKAEGQPGPPMQAMALSPPTFRSEGARAGA